MSAPLYVVEIAAYDPATAGIVVLRYATHGFTTTPADSPPNTFYDGRLKQPAVLRRDLFSTGRTVGRSRVSYGDLVLENGDGLLDALVDYGFDGRSVLLRRGILGAAYPGAFALVAELTAEQVEATQNTITVKLRDRQRELEIPLQPMKYAGDNVLPDGLEGVDDDLLGKPKPRCFGVVKNVPAVLVNTARLIYQVSDGPIASLDAVYDRGIRLTGSAWPTASAFGSNFDTIHCCCFGNDLYVMGGEDNTVSRLATSPDGVNWTLRTSAEVASASWRSVVWSPDLGLFVAVGVGAGGNSAAISSPDGVTWTTRTLGWTEPGAARSVAWGAKPGLFVAVGVGGRLVTSPDGSTWTSRTSGTANDLNEVTYGNGLFVAVASGGVVITSPDGITWTTRGSFGGGTAARSVTFGTNPQGVPVFVAVGDSGSLATSVDGIDWIVRQTGVAVTLWAVRFEGQQFLAVGASGTVLISANGVEWTSRASGWGAGSLLDVCHGPPGWLLTGDNQQYSLSFYGTYADLAALESDSVEPAPGEVKVYLDGGYFRLGAPPAGLVTADVTEGPLAGDRTAAQLFAKLLSDPLGAPLLEFSSADVATLDIENDSPLGFWSGTEELTVAESIDLLAASVGAWWGVDRTGILRIQQFTAPSGSPLYAFTANDLQRPLVRLPIVDETRGLPVWRTLLRYARNYAAQTVDLAAGVSDARRAFVAKEWREAKAEDAAVQTVHPLAPELLEDSLLALEADAQAEATRRQTLRGAQRHRFEIVVPLTGETEVLDLFQVVTLTHARYGLGAGPSFRILGLEPDVERRQLTLQLWK